MSNETSNKTTAELDATIADLESRISALPKGSITHKRVNGHVYPYHRWSEGGKRKERYLPADEAEELAAVTKRLRTLLEIRNEEISGSRSSPGCWWFPPRSWAGS